MATLLSALVDHDRADVELASDLDATAAMVDHVAAALEHRLTPAESEQLAALRRRGAPRMTALVLVTQQESRADCFDRRT